MSKKHPPPWRWEIGRGLVDGNDVTMEIRSTSMSEETEDDEAVKRLIAAAPEMEALLRKLQWLCMDRDYPEPRCPECGEEESAMPQHHAPDCALGSLLSRVDVARKA